MNKEITQNLLKDRICDNCEHYVHLPGLKNASACSLKKKSKYPTCTDWADKGFLIAAVTQQDFEQMLVTKEFLFKIDRECTIHGTRLYNAKTKELIFEQRFSDGPYVFGPAGGSLKIKFSS